MAAMQINTDYKPKYGQDPALFNQMYMDYIQNLGSEGNSTDYESPNTRPYSQQSS